VNSRHVVFKIHYTIQNQILRLAHGIRTRYYLAKVLQIKVLNIVPHVRNAFKGTSPVVVYILFVPDTEDTLGLA
jgi:CRISPR/Cas system endoribonuclease Cas6 (RAMP superfamily)